jgi:hypothetical protein
MQTVTAVATVPAMTDWITAREAAQILGVHMSAIPKMLRRGDLTKRSRRPILNRAEVLAYREAREAARLRPLKPRPLKGSPAPPDDEHDWLSSERAAAIMGVGSGIAVNARARRGRIPSVLLNGRRWYRRDHLELVLRADAAKRDRHP